MYGRGSHDRLTDSGDWRERIVLTEHRYMREDLRLGLSLLVSVAELAGVATPLAISFLAIGGAICGEDFLQGGRTLTTSRSRRPRSRRIADAAARGFLTDDRSPSRHRLPRRRPHGPRHRGGLRLCRPCRHHDRRQAALGGTVRETQGRSARRGQQDAGQPGAVRVADGQGRRDHHRAGFGGARGRYGRRARRRRHRVRRRARGGRAQARGAGGGFEMRRTRRHHRLDHVDHSGRRSLRRGRTPGSAFSTCTGSTRPI